MPTTGFSPVPRLRPAHPFTDPVTGCANQTVLAGRLEDLAHRPERTVAVLFADIDEHGVIRRTHGQNICDRVMTAVAGRLTRLIRPGDTLARLDGNRFVVVRVEDDDEQDTIESLAASIEAASNGTFGIAGTRFEVASTVGIAFAGRGEDVPAEILHDTEVAGEAARARKRSAGDADIIDLRPMTSLDEVTPRTVLDPIV